MSHYSEAAEERTMKLQQIIIKAISKQITWLQAARIIGISARQMQRWGDRYEKLGYEGLYDRRRGSPRPKRVPMERVAEVLRLYREKYEGFNVRHFHEKLVAEHGITLSYTWVKTACKQRGVQRVEFTNRRGQQMFFYRARTRSITYNST